MSENSEKKLFHHYFLKPKAVVLLVIFSLLSCATKHQTIAITKLEIIHVWHFGYKA